MVMKFQSIFSLMTILAGFSSGKRSYRICATKCDDASNDPVLENITIFYFYTFSWFGLPDNFHSCLPRWLSSFVKTSITATTDDSKNILNRLCSILNEPYLQMWKSIRLECSMIVHQSGWNHTFLCTFSMWFVDSVDCHFILDLAIEYSTVCNKAHPGLNLLELANIFSFFF